MIQIRKWFIFTEFGTNEIPCVLDLSNEDVDDEDIAWCIQEQLFGKYAFQNLNEQEKIK